MNHRAYKAVAVAIVIALLFISTRIDEASVSLLAERLGWFGPFVLGAGIFASQVAAPISAGPSFFVAIRLYGYASAALILFAASMLSGAVNFWLAKRYGHAVVARLGGKGVLRRVDELSDVDEKRLLIVGRLFGYPLFDAFSYALGLTPLSYGTYLALTFVCSIPPAIAYYFLYRNLDFSSVGGIALYYGSLGLTSAALAWCAYALLGKRKASAKP